MTARIARPGLRGICSVCERDRRVRLDGLMAEHPNPRGWSFGLCPGTGQPPTVSKGQTAMELEGTTPTPLTIAQSEKSPRLQPGNLPHWPLPDETMPAELLDYLAAMWSNRSILVATEWCYLPGRCDSGAMADVERLAKGRLYQQLAEFGFTTLVTPRVMWTRCPEDVVPTGSREPREVDWAPGDLVQIGDRLVCRVSAFSIPLMHPMVVQ